MGDALLKVSVVAYEFSRKNINKSMLLKKSLKGTKLPKALMKKYS